MNEDIEELVRTKTQTQPFIVCKNYNKFDTNESQMYIIVDDYFFECTDDFISAFDVLYKVHYVFNLKFDQSVAKFYNFFDCYIYKIKNIKPLGLVSNFFKKMSLN